MDMPPRAACRRSYAHARGDARRPALCAGVWNRHACELRAPLRYHGGVRRPGSADRRRWIAAAFALHALVFAGAVGAASAQSGAPQSNTSGQDRVAVARALFEEGLSHVDNQRWALAADCFSRLLALKYSAVAQYNLALSQARLGNALRAVELLQALLAEPQLEPTVRKASVDLFEEQRRQVAWLEVRIGGDCEGCTVGVDDRRLPGEAHVDAITVAVAPGSHVLRLMRADTQLSSSQVDVSRGQWLEIELVANQPTVTPSAMVAAASLAQPGGTSDASSVDASLDRTQSEDSSGGLLASPWFWGAIGAVVVGSIALGFALGSGEPAAASPVPGDFTPGVIAGVVSP